MMGISFTSTALATGLDIIFFCDEVDERVERRDGAEVESVDFLALLVLRPAAGCGLLSSLRFPPAVFPFVDLVTLAATVFVLVSFPDAAGEVEAAGLAVARDDAVRDDERRVVLLSSFFTGSVSLALDAPALPLLLLPVVAVSASALLASTAALLPVALFFFTAGSASSPLRLDTSPCEIRQHWHW